MSKFRGLKFALAGATAAGNSLWRASRGLFGSSSSSASEMPSRGKGSYSRSRKRRSTVLSIKKRSRRSSRTKFSRKRKFKSRRKAVNKRREWKMQRRITRGTLSTQPTWTETAIMTQRNSVVSGSVCFGGLPPIAVWSAGGTAGQWPYPNTSDGAPQYSDLTRIAAKIGVWNGTLTDPMLDQNQLIKIEFSRVQYQIRNNTNIALNVKMFHFRPRKNGFGLNPGEIKNFPTIMDTAILDAGVVNATYSPLSHPVDFPYFNKHFKITKQVNKRLLPGEAIYVSNVAMVNKIMNSSHLNVTFMKTYSKFFGYQVWGDPVHDDTHVSTSSGQLDVIATYKFQFRRLDVPTLQNKVYQDNDLFSLIPAAQVHTAAFANLPNDVQF